MPPKEWRDKNRQKVRDDNAQWKRENRPKVRASKRRWRSRNKGEKRRDSILRQLYGVTVEWYDAKLKEQDGKCAICRRPPTEGQRLGVDHNHETNEPRGLLCNNCNPCLYIVERMPDWGGKALAYLARYARAPRDTAMDHGSSDASGGTEQVRETEFQSDLGLESNP